MKSIDENELIQKVAEKYGIDLEHPEKYDITKLSVSRKVNREIAEQCYPEIRAWDMAEQASRAAARCLPTC